MDDLKIREQDWTPVELAYSLWLRTARETAGSSLALARTIKKHLARAGALENVPARWNSDFVLTTDAEWARRTIKRWESGNLSGARPQQTPDKWLREALISVVTELVPAAPAELGWATFRDVSDAFTTERSEQQQPATEPPQ